MTDGVAMIEADTLYPGFEFKEPWADMSEYPVGNGEALLQKLHLELSKGHPLQGMELQVIARREDRDDLLLLSGENYFVVHLTWSRKREEPPFPLHEQFSSPGEVRMKLEQDAWE
jgi:hypothetical protein